MDAGICSDDERRSKPEISPEALRAAREELQQAYETYVDYRIKPMDPELFDLIHSMKQGESRRLPWTKIHAILDKHGLVSRYKHGKTLAMAYHREVEKRNDG